MDVWKVFKERKIFKNVYPTISILKAEAPGTTFAGLIETIFVYGTWTYFTIPFQKKKQKKKNLNWNYWNLVQQKHTIIHVTPNSKQTKSTENEVNSWIKPPRTNIWRDSDCVCPSWNFNCSCYISCDVTPTMSKKKKKNQNKNTNKNIKERRNWKSDLEKRT